MGVCESGKNTEETNIQSGSQTKHPKKIRKYLSILEDVKKFFKFE